MNEWFNVLVSSVLNAIDYGNTAALLGLGALAALTDIGLPVPFVLETLLFTTSFQLGPFSRQVLLIALTLLMGRQLGAAVLYVLARVLGNVLIRWLGRHFHQIPGNLAKIEARLNKRAFLGVMTARLAPGLLQLSSVAAGLIKVRYFHVFLGVALASLVYDGILVTLGFLAAKGLTRVGVGFSIWVVVGFLALISLAWLIFGLLSRRRSHTL